MLLFSPLYAYRVVGFLFIQSLYVNILFQISDFGAAKADFGTDLAISTRSELNPGSVFRLVVYSVHISCM